MKIGQEQIHYINAIESIAGVSAKDCIVKDNEIIFVVNENQLGKAIGKNGSTAKKIKEKIGKKIELFEYSENPIDFVKKAFYGISIKEAKKFEKKQEKIIEISFDEEDKKEVFQNKGKIKKIQEILKRIFDISQLKIL